MTKSNPHSKATVFIAAGGTGGHIFPALALAESLKQLEPSLEIVFFGARGGREEKWIPEHGYPLKTVKIGRLHRNVSAFERIRTLIQLPLALLRCLFWVMRSRPRFVLGVGGHASAPILLAASLFRIPTFIWEPNAYPGLTNRWLSHFVSHSLVVFESAKRMLRTPQSRQVGLPVRRDIESLSSRELVKRDGALRILVLGGSQGARPINRVIREVLVDHGEVSHQWNWVHQTGELDHEEIMKAYIDNNISVVECQTFLDDMPRRLEQADLVICRCGTGTISELAAAGVPSILIPLPSAADEHQKKNADAVENLGGGVLLLQKDLTAENLIAKIRYFDNNREELVQMAQNVRGFHQKDSARVMGEWILEQT